MSQDRSLSNVGLPVGLEREKELARNERRIIALTSVGHALCHISEQLYAGLLLPLMLEFNVKKFQVTALGFTGYALMGLGAIPAGMATDRWGARRVLIVYFVCVAGSVTLVAMVGGAWTLAVALTVLGAAISLYHPAGLAMLAGGCRARGRAMGINGVAGSIGIALGSALGAYMVLLGSWRLAYLMVAAVALAGGIAMALLRFDESAAEQTPAASPKTSRSDQQSANGLWLLFAAMLLGGLNYRCLMTALPTYLIGEGQGAADLGPGATRVLVVLTLGGIGQYFGGHASDKMQPTLLYALLIAATIPLALSLAHGTGTPIVAVAAVLAIFVFALPPVENNIVARATSARRRSTIYGLRFALTFGVGALGTPLAGWIWEKAGTIAAVFNLFACNALLMALFAVCLLAVQMRSSTGRQSSQLADGQL